MTHHYKTLGFVFKKEDRLEADRVFSVLTKEFGRLEIFGKAIRKIASKLRGSMDIFYLSDIEFIQGKNKKTLTDAILVEKFPSIAKDPEKFKTALRISDALHQFIKGEEQDEKILELIVDSFKKLEHAQSVQLIYAYFFWNFLALLGYSPELSSCVACRKNLLPAGLYFSFADGGVTCKECAKAKKAALINEDVVKVLRLLVKREWDILKKLKLPKRSEMLLHGISDEYYSYLASHEVSYLK